VDRELSAGRQFDARLDDEGIFAGAAWCHHQSKATRVGAGLMCAGGGCGTSGVVTARSWAWLSLIPLTCVKAGPVAVWHLLVINRHEGGDATNNNTTLNPHYVLLSM